MSDLSVAVPRIIPIIPVNSQSLTVNLADQDCRIDIYTKHIQVPIQTPMGPPRPATAFHTDRGRWECHFLDRPEDSLENYTIAISADGNWAIGYDSGGSPRRALLWNLNDYTVSILQPDSVFNTPIELSYDGSVYTKFTGDPTVDMGYVSGGVFTALPVPFPLVSTIPRGGYISDDAHTIVGSVAIAPRVGPSTPLYQSCYWIDGGAANLLPVHNAGVLPAGYDSFCTSVSTNGTIIIGLDTPVGDTNTSIAVKWVNDGSGWTEVDLDEGVNGRPADISSDGSIIAGRFVRSGQGIACYWLEDATVVALSSISGVTGQSAAVSVSGDGRRIVGYCGGSTSGHPTLWTDGFPMELPLPNGQYLNYSNGDAGYTMGISADGKTIVGELYLYDADGNPLDGFPNYNCVWKLIESDPPESIGGDYFIVTNPPVFGEIDPIFLDLYINDVLILGGVLCLNNVAIVRDPYLGFIGDLAFTDLTGDEDPQVSGLGFRWLLNYWPNLK